jgi:hypothetical protein
VKIAPLPPWKCTPPRGVSQYATACLSEKFFSDFLFFSWLRRKVDIDFEVFAVWDEIL